MDFKQYMGKSILAWHYFNENFEDNNNINTRCYVYPRVLIQNGHYELINAKEDFPLNGRIEVRIQGGDTAEEVFQRLGKLVRVKINANIPPNYNSNNIYSLKYNSQFGKGSSEIWIESFSGKGFYQIIDIDKDINEVKEARSILDLEEKIYTTIILLRHEDKIFGPFEYDIKESMIYLFGLKSYQYMVGEYLAINYNDNLCIIEDNNDEESISMLPSDFLENPNNCEYKYDWISNEKLLDNFMATVRTGNSYTREQFRKIKDTFDQLIQNNAEILLTEKRSEKVKQYIDKISAQDAHINDILQYFLEDKDFKEHLITDIVKNHFDLIENNITNYKETKDRINALQSEKESLKTEIENLQSEEGSIKSIVNCDNQQKIEGLEKKIGELTEDLKKEKENNNNLKELLDTKKSIQQLSIEKEKYIKDKNEALNDYNKQIITNNQLQKDFEETLRRYSDKASTIARGFDSKLLERILREAGGEKIEDEVIVSFDSTLLNNPMTDKEIIKRVADYIRDQANRDVTDNDVANYLICISQGFITTFAGEPGTGKTSLCSILAKSLGLVTDDITQRRFIDVSVERGWTSHKDFIGYYNPLTKSMEKSNSEVFNALRLISNEHQSTDIAPYLILLDEANLSPIEHYWAVFLRNCDFDSIDNKTISLGGKDNWIIPDHLRFLATVNFDHTTEELSPRFLDRSWIITLTPNQINDEPKETIKNCDNMVPFSSIKDSFLPKEKDVTDEAINDKWNAIQSIFRKQAVPIMPRNLKMVRNYCSVACKCMIRETPSTKLAPLDYAFSQKILPTINGSGENYRNLIDDLQKECTEQNMPLSAKHLERIQRIAKNNLGFYQFFSH